MTLSELRNASHTYKKQDTYDMRARQEIVRKIWIRTKEDNINTEKDGIRTFSRMLGDSCDYLYNQLGEIENFKKERNRNRRRRKNQMGKIKSSEVATIAMEAVGGKLLGTGGKKSICGNVKSPASGQAWQAARGQ